MKWIMDKEIMDMKTFCKQVLIIGGFYFIISYLLFMYNGYILEQGSPEYIFSECKNQRLLEFLSIDNK